MERSSIFLEEVATGEFVEADLFDEITDEQLTAWRDTWMPEVNAAKQRLLAQCLPGPQWPTDLHWDWDAKIAEARETFLASKGFSVVYQNRLQGLMLVDLSNRRSARLPEQNGKPLVYVEYLATAPWNRKELGFTPRYRGIGRALILASVELSLQEEFRGRIGLHSLPQADDFYRRKCGMTAVGADPKYQNLTYFEMTPEQAKKFRGA